MGGVGGGGGWAGGGAKGGRGGEKSSGLGFIGVEIEASDSGFGFRVWGSRFRYRRDCALKITPKSSLAGFAGSWGISC